MGQHQRRPGFLRWGETARPDAQQEEQTAGAGANDAAGSAEVAAPEQTAELPADESATAGPVDAAEPVPDPTPFLQDLVGAMRGVAESSRETSLRTARDAVEHRVEELTSSAEERTQELRRRSELDLNGIADWERSELERVRGEAEQRRQARQAELERELEEHRTATERDVAATRAQLEEHERALDAFFAQLSEISDPAEFVVAAKRMPAPPDLASPSKAPTPAAAEAARPAQEATPPVEHAAPPAADASTPVEAAEPAAATAVNGASVAAANATLADRLAQLDRKLAEKPGAEAPPTDSPAPGPESGAGAAAPAAATTTATMAPAEAPSAAPAAETSTAIVVKGLGSFGAITSFKQALERVDGVRGVTLSLGPTGDFVYRASHAADFDIVSAIRSIEGPNAAIEQSDGSIRVTIERPR